MGRGTHRQPEQPLGRAHDERLAEVALDLAPQEVEVLRGRRRVHDVHVHVQRCARLVRVVRELVAADRRSASTRSHVHARARGGTDLQHPLIPGRRVFRARAVQSVREEEYDPALLQPFCWSTM